MACSKLSNALDLDEVIDKILEHSPIRVAARASVLSKQWRRSWLSLKTLVFDADFWNEQDHDGEDYHWQKCRNIIGNILLNHNGPIHNFHVYNPTDANGDGVHHKQWLYLLMNNEVRSITFDNRYDTVDIGSHIFRCSELVHLKLVDVFLQPPPTDFNGFRVLKHLELTSASFKDENVFCSMIAHCRMLATLKLEGWHRMDHVVIDVPSLETLIIKGCFESLTFRNVRNLKTVCISLSLTMYRDMPKTIGLFDTINHLASSCQLESIEFSGHLCELLGAGTIIRSLPVSFDHLNKLCLNDVYLSDFRIFSCVLGIIESCPYIKKLDILVTPSFPGVTGDQHEYECNQNSILRHLLEVNITGLSGSNSDFLLMHYLLSISVVLEKLSIKSLFEDSKLEWKILQVVMGFPRASPIVQFLCLEKSSRVRRNRYKTPIMGRALVLGQPVTDISEL